MDANVKLALSCCMLLCMPPLFVAATRHSAVSRDIKVEKYLARMNKPYVKSIKVPDGDIIDCVLIGDQPAFDNPLLKNHSIRVMRPSNYPEEASKNVTRIETKFQLWQLYGSCPDGTIPIRRTRKEDVLRANSLEEYATKIQAGTHEHAIAYETGGKFYGARATLNVWEPYVEPADEFSLTQIWVIANDGSIKNTVEAGWQVCPVMYGDARPRLFIYFTNNSYQPHSGCYNLECTGFVQIHSKISVGAVLSPVSSYNQEQFEMTFTIFKDIFNNWWLKINDELLGYWPATILPVLSGGATEIHWGGEVVNQRASGHHTTTDMGSGHFPYEGFRRASYVRNMEVIPEDDKWSSPRNLDSFSYQNNCYSIDINYNGGWGTHFYYGGPGFTPKCKW